MEVTRNINFIECEVSKVHGLAVPGSPEVAEQYACTTDEGGSLFFDSDASELLGAGFVSGDARLALAPQVISDSGSINIQRAMIPGLVAISAGSNDGVNRKSKVAAIGNKQLLVIRVVSNDYEPAQSEAQLYDDVFGDDNNLVSKDYSSAISVHVIAPYTNRTTARYTYPYFVMLSKYDRESDTTIAPMARSSLTQQLVGTQTMVSSLLPPQKI